MTLKPGDKFRVVEAYQGLQGKKFVCHRVFKDRLNGHELGTMVEFKQLDYFGNESRYAVPIGWCAYEPPNGPARRK